MRLFLPLALLAWEGTALAQEPTPEPPHPEEHHEHHMMMAPNVQRVRVDVDSTREGSVLERRISVTETNGALVVLPYEQTASSWEQVCVSPCRGLMLDRASMYRVANANKTTGSKEFTLPTGTEAVHLSIDAGNLPWHRFGIIVTTLGVIAAGIGAGFISAQKAFSNEDHAKTAGLITGAGGLALMAVGIPIILLTRSHVSANDGRDVAER